MTDCSYTQVEFKICGMQRGECFQLRFTRVKRRRLGRYRWTRRSMIIMFEGFIIRMEYLDEIYSSESVDKECC